MESRIYWSGIEYKYEEKETNKLGGFVYVFLKAKDVRNALELILSGLKAKELIPLDVEFVSVYDEETEWENTKQKEHYLNLYKSALKSSKIEFDNFYAYVEE